MDQSADTCSAESPAYIQYTSGSTATPRGVVISHSNVLHNLDAMRRNMGCRSNDLIGSWLPFFHDMGLIGGLIRIPGHPLPSAFSDALCTAAPTMAPGNITVSDNNHRGTKLCLRTVCTAGDSRGRRRPGPLVTACCRSRSGASPHVNTTTICRCISTVGFDESVSQTLVRIGRGDAIGKRRSQTSLPHFRSIRFGTGGPRRNMAFPPPITAKD